MSKQTEVESAADIGRFVDLSMIDQIDAFVRTYNNRRNTGEEIEREK